MTFFSLLIMYEKNKMGRDRTVVSTEVEREWEKGDTQRQRTPQGKKKKAQGRDENVSS